MNVFRPILDKYVKFDKDAMAASGLGVNYWNSVAWLMFALDNYITKECPAEENRTCKELVDIAKQVDNIGRQKM